MDTVKIRPFKTKTARKRLKHWRTGEEGRRHLGKGGKTWKQLIADETSWEHLKLVGNSWKQLRPDETIWQQLKKVDHRWNQVRTLEASCEHLKAFDNSWNMLRKAEKSWDLDPDEPRTNSDELTVEFLNSDELKVEFLNSDELKVEFLNLFGFSPFLGKLYVEFWWNSSCSWLFFHHLKLMLMWFT